ncbi:MAG TPA: electron transfer flavoprotein subunit beta/FixA family protein [Nitriliruptorales bacterium]
MDTTTPASGTTIAVAVKHVPVGGAFLRVQSGGLTRDGVSHGIDPLNEVAVEWALQAREAGAADRVVAISLGPPAAVDALRRALAMGADEAVLVTDPTFAGADVRATARALAAATERSGARLLVAGYESLDGSSGAVPAAVAASLGWPLVSRFSAGAIHGGALRATRDLGAGPTTIEVDLPAVVSIVEGHVTPRFPKLKDVVRTRSVQPTTYSGADLGLSLPTSGERVVDLVEVAQPPREPTILDLEAGIEELFARLTQGASRG